MAVEISDGAGTPHATDYADLLSKLITFATANGWTQLENSADKTVLQGEGAGSDEIIVAIQKYADVGTDSQGWFLNGYTGYQSGLTFLQQPGALPEYTSGSAVAYPSLPLWNSTIPYWFIVSSRRIIVVAKIATTYHMAYLGWYLPFASPNQYPYPLMIGGSVAKNSSTAKPRYSNASSPAGSFWSGRNTSPPTLMNQLPGGTWKFTTNAQVSPTFLTTQAQEQGLFPYNQTVDYSIANMQPALDGSAVLTPITWVIGSSGTPELKGAYGELDGLYHLSGVSRASEDIITIASDDYLVVQDIFRTGVSDFVAVKLV